MKTGKHDIKMKSRNQDFKKTWYLNVFRKLRKHDFKLTGKQEIKITGFPENKISCHQESIQVRKHS
jgi:hypothetical protein